MTDDARPDDAARLAREMVERLTELAWRHPESWYYRTCLEGWLLSLANPTQYAADKPTKESKT